MVGVRTSSRGVNKAKDINRNFLLQGKGTDLGVLSQTQQREEANLLSYLQSVVNRKSPWICGPVLGAWGECLLAKTS